MITQEYLALAVYLLIGFIVAAASSCHDPEPHPATIAIIVMWPLAGLVALLAMASWLPWAVGRAVYKRWCR